MVTVEFLISPGLSQRAWPLMRGLEAAARADAGVSVRSARHYCGGSHVLVLYGVGAPERAEARRKQIAAGGSCIMWDVGYFGAGRPELYMRCSINHDHPQAWLDRAPNDPARLAVQRIRLREESHPDGHIVLVGLGQKSRNYLGCANWEREKLVELRARFPGRRIVYRPKPNQARLDLGCAIMAEVPIEYVIRGASLVVARHSNVTVDATIAGVPFECEDGAAMWLAKRPFTPDNRIDFLQRLAWWNWHAGEAAQAWAFLRGMLT